ncbi:MAG: hypothetical protein GEU98_11625 [Pseudonocardiaceae bacterium]|nr:hypothetical protein [Pseudonocardiaceae bacterium]
MTVDAATEQHTSNGETADADPAPEPAEAEQTDSGATESAEAEKPKRKPRKQSTARKTRSVELTLTVTGTADGEWQADLMHGTKRVVRGLTIPAAAVSRAAKELHDDISGAIEQVLDAAREQHRSRVEELQAELEKAQQALAELQE